MPKTKCFDGSRIGLDEDDAGAVFHHRLRQLGRRPRDERAKAFLSFSVDERHSYALSRLNTRGQHELRAADRKIDEATPLAVDDDFYVGFHRKAFRGPRAARFERL